MYESPPREVSPLDPLYVNIRRVATLVGTERLQAAVSAVHGWNEKQTLGLRAVRTAELLHTWLIGNEKKIEPLHVAWLKGNISPGVLFTYEGHLHCRNAQGRQQGVEPLAHTGVQQLGVDGTDLRLELGLHPDHVVSGSPGDLLSKKVGNLFAIAQAHRIENSTLKAIPLFIGRLVNRGLIEVSLPPTRNEVFVDSIDSFREVNRVRPPSLQKLKVLRDIPEASVKDAFAEIIGEPDVPKGWAGERSDLYTTYLRISGQRVSSAFLFKGPAGGRKFREMKILDLGKNGDQVERLVEEPADLLIVQHCHQIGAPVRNMVRAFCNQFGRERRYCLISGYDTYRIFKAYGKCGI